MCPCDVARKGVSGEGRQEKQNPRGGEIGAKINIFSLKIFHDLKIF